MSFNAKFISITAFFTAAAVCSFLAAYKLFSAPSKVNVGEAAYEAGFYLGNAPSNEAEEKTDIAQGAENTVQTEDSAAEQAISQSDKITEDTVIVYEYYYEDGGKIEKAEQKAPRALLNLTREQVVSRIEGFSVVAFSSREVVLRKKIAASKTSQYVLGIWDGNVAVFYGGSGTNRSGLKEVTDTPVSSLSEEEKERLSDGILIEGDSELMKVLEDYGS